MSETSDPIDSGDLDLLSGQVGPTESQSGNSLISLDGSLPSIRSVSLILQALLPLLLSIVFLVAGKRLYRFTTTASVALSSALFTWVLFVNLETGQSIGRWTGEVAAVTVWSVMIGGSLIGALIGYQLTWWGAHVTGRLCLGINSGVGFAFSVLLLRSELLIHSSGGQWSLVGAFAAMGIFIVFWDHVIGPLVAITACGSFLFLIGADMFNTLGLNGVAAGLRLLLDHNSEHSMYITSYNPPKSTIVLIGVSWAIGLISFGFQYVCYSAPFGPLPPPEPADEERDLESETKTKESISDISITQPPKESPPSELESAATDPSQAVCTNTNRGSNGTSVGTNTSATLIDSNRPPEPNQEPSSLPYLSSRASSTASGEHRSPAALALSPSIYSRYRRTQDSVHKPPSRSPIQYQFHSNLFNFTNSRRVETVEEVTESSPSVGGGELATRSSNLDVVANSEVLGSSNSINEEYINAMMCLASGESNNSETNKLESKATNSADSDNQDNHRQRIGTAKAGHDAQPALEPICETGDAPENSEQQSEAKAVISSSISSPVHSNTALIPSQVETNTPSYLAMDFPSVTQPDRPEAQQDATQSKIELTQPPKSLPNGRPSTAPDPGLLRSNQVDHISAENRGGEEGDSTWTATNGVLGRTQARCDELTMRAHSSPASPKRGTQELAAVPQPGVRTAYSEGDDPDSSTLGEDHEAGSARDKLTAPREVDVADLKRFSHRALPITPSQLPTSYDVSTSAHTQETASYKMRKTIDARSLKSANSNVSSMLDSFLQVSHDSSVPTTPSSTGKNMQEENKQSENVYVPSRTRLSIVTGKQAQLPRKMSTRTQTSQEAQIDSLPDLSPASNYSAVPHTPTLGNMLLRVSEGAEKLRRQSDITDLKAHTTSPEASSDRFPGGEDTDNEDAATLRSEPSRKSTICRSSIYADHTSAEDGGKSCSESEEDDDQSHEQYFNPRRMQKLDRALGEWGNFYSDKPTTEDETEGSQSSHTNNGDITKRSPSLQSIPLPSLQNKLGSSHAFSAQSSTDATPIGPTPFVGKPLVDIPWPQLREPKRNESGLSGLEAQQKRWTTASSIFPPLGEESSMESPPPSHLLQDEGDETDSYASDHGPDRFRVLRSSRISTGTRTSFEGDANNYKQNAMFCSASSHIADDHDMSDITSRIDDTTDDEDPNYESAADYSRSFRPSLGATDGGYISAEDGAGYVDL